MNNLFQNNIGEEGEHPPRETLLLYVDGELSSKEAARAQAHLEACWHCRVKTKKIEETIADIIEFDVEVLKPRLLPKNNWRGFDRRLNQLAAEGVRPSLLSRVLGPLGRLFSKAPFFVMPRPLVRVAAGLLVAVVIVALVIRFNREPVVSASELLRNATEARATQISKTAQPVIHQQLRVRRKGGAALRTESVDWEIWNDATRSRFRQSVSEGGGRRFLPAVASPETGGGETSPVPEVLLELNHVLRANHMDPQRPLSPDSYQAWRNSLGQKSEEVTRSQLAGGGEALTLRTAPAGPVEAGRIAEATLVVRARDWHPGELRLRVRAEGGDREYELVETAFEVVSLPALSAEVFPDQPGVLIAPNPTPGPTPKASPSPQPSLNANAAPVPVPPVRAVATAELEVEVLRLLNQVGADLGEQLTVTRTEGGPVRVSGIVETEQRKSEILSALGPVAHVPGVQIDVQTVAEAVAAQKQKNAAESRPVTTQGVEIQSSRLAAEPELRAYFERQGGNPDEEVRRFAARMAGGSRQAMQHLGAMKRLVNQFSPEELRTLTPEARAKWLGLIRGHARAYQQQSAALRRELKPVFFPGASEGLGAAGEAITADAELARAVGRLFEMGAANDEVIRSAFTTSAGGATVTAIQTPQFWQAMKTAEALAAAIQSAQ